MAIVLNSTRLESWAAAGGRVILVLAFVTMTGVAPSFAVETLRAGLVGCDTSHVIAFTKALNGQGNEDKYSGVRVVCAYPGGSEDIPASRDRVPVFTAQLSDMGVEIVDTLDELRDKCDVYFLESSDARVHLDQFRAIAHGAPVFVDKPAAISLAELLELVEIAEQTGTPCFSTSALRFCGEVSRLKSDDSLGVPLGAATSSPYRTEPHHPDLFWYGIHGMEALHTLMGLGCQRVSHIETESAGVVVGEWEGGRIGVFRGIKEGGGPNPYTFSAYGSNHILQGQGFDGYEPMLAEICKFFRSEEAPVRWEETIELFAAMEAAHESKRRNGAPVALQEMIDRARVEVAQKRAATRGGTSDDTNPD